MLNKTVSCTYGHDGDQLKMCTHKTRFSLQRLNWMGQTNKTRHFFWENKCTADSDTLQPTVKTQLFFSQDTAVSLGQSACSSSADGVQFS